MNEHSETDAPRPAWTAEKVAWWIAFGILTASIVAMLGLWN